MPLKNHRTRKEQRHKDAVARQEQFDAKVKDLIDNPDDSDFHSDPNVVQKATQIKAVKNLPPSQIIHLMKQLEGNEDPLVKAAYKGMEKALKEKQAAAKK